MAIGRSRYAPPVSTKGHSVLKTRSYGLSSRAPPTSYVTPRSSAHSTRGEEYLLADRVSNVNYLSNALLDEGYDTALRSRGRDQALLKEATNAIVSSESYATPQTSVASRRVARGDSVGTRAASVPPRPPPKQERSKSSSYSSRQYGSTGSTRGTGADDEKLNPLMSWKYRLDSVTSPSDLLYQPSSLIRIREQVKNAKEKMSRTKEMLEKYLPDEGIDSMDVAASIRMKMSAMEKRNPGLAHRREKAVREDEEDTTAELED